MTHGFDPRRLSLTPHILPFPPLSSPPLSSPPLLFTSPLLPSSPLPSSPHIFDPLEPVRPLTGNLDAGEHEHLGDDDGRPAEAVGGHDAEEAQRHLHLPHHQRRVAPRLLDVEEHGRVRADDEDQTAEREGG